MYNHNSIFCISQFYFKFKKYVLFNIIVYDNIIIKDNKGSNCILSKIDIILHPVRFKIIQSFLDGQRKTAKMLAKELKEIPQATLYRQLDALVKADVLDITEENQIRGTVEKVYALNTSAVHMTNDDIKELTKEEHLQYFLFFTAQLTKLFEEYLKTEDIDFERDGVGYRQAIFNLSNEEFQAFIEDLKKVYEKYANNPPTPVRRKRTISTIIIPEKGGGGENE